MNTLSHAHFLHLEGPQEQGHAWLKAGTHLSAELVHLQDPEFVAVEVHLSAHDKVFDAIVHDRGFAQHGVGLESPAPLQKLARGSAAVVDPG